MNQWPQQWPVFNAPVQQWPGFGAPQPQPQPTFNQFGQPAPHGLWPFNNNDNNPSPWRGSSKYHDLHPILASDTTMVSYNVSKKPNTSIPPAAYMTHMNFPATRIPSTHIRLISPSFPWSVDIHWHAGVTVNMVWEALHAVFQADIEDSEWGAAVVDRKLRGVIEKAAKKRIEGGGAKRLRRIDWLGEGVMFRGLEKDEAFTKGRVLMGEKEHPETWVVKLAT